MERILSVQTVKLVGPGLSSISPQRRRKARRKGLRQRSVHGQVAIERTVNEVRVRYEYCLHAV